MFKINLRIISIRTNHCINQKNKIMKFLKYALLFAAATIMFSCSDDDNGNEPQPIDETEGLLLTKTFENQNHKIAIYTESGKLTDGYNKVYLQLKTATAH